MMAELLKHYYPKLVELHNYTSANCLTHKVNNWLTLSRKVSTPPKLEKTSSKSALVKGCPFPPGTIKAWNQIEQRSNRANCLGLFRMHHSSTIFFKAKDRLC